MVLKLLGISMVSKRKLQTSEIFEPYYTMDLNHQQPIYQKFGSIQIHMNHWNPKIPWETLLHQSKATFGSQQNCVGVFILTWSAKTIKFHGRQCYIKAKLHLEALLQKKILGDILFWATEAAGWRPASVNLGWAASRATVTDNCLTVAVTVSKPPRLILR